MIKKKVEILLEEAIDNIRSDRLEASDLLVGLTGMIKSNPELHTSAGLVVAKYLETLQRSNEQLVKIAEIYKKTKDDNILNLKNEEKTKFYEDFEKLEVEIIKK